MNTEIFWKMIEISHQIANNNMDKQIDLLISSLTELSIEDIKMFDQILRDTLIEAYREDMWEVAFIINCGCSDDGFFEFCFWLIAQGKHIFYNTLANPEYLSRIVNLENRHDIIDGRLSDVARETYAKLTGERKILSGYRKQLRVNGSFDEDKLGEKYPTLFAKFGDCE